MNPAHADILNPKLWECEADGEHKDDRGLKGGCTRLTTIKEIPLPVWTNEEKIKFAILCAIEVYGGKSGNWDRWAENWLTGADRSSNSARAAAYAADASAAAAYAAYASAADSAAYAAYAAAYAAYAAAYAKTIDFSLIIKEIKGME
jgi:hypothetical protein